MKNDADQSADGTDRLLQPWQRFAFQLSPLIGDSGFCALYGRAARLASGRFPWIAPGSPVKTIDAALAALRGQYAVAGADDAARANAVLLTTFTKLLTGLIGEALTMQLLDAAPAAVSAYKPALESLE